jgi:hypothetical protein
MSHHPEIYCVLEKERTYSWISKKYFAQNFFFGQRPVAVDIQISVCRSSNLILNSNYLALYVPLMHVHCASRFYPKLKCITSL